MDIVNLYLKKNNVYLCLRENTQHENEYGTIVVYVFTFKC